MSDRTTDLVEEPVAKAFERLREDLVPLTRFSRVEVQFVESCWQLQPPSTCTRTVTGADDSSRMSAASFPLLQAENRFLVVVV